MIKKTLPLLILAVFLLGACGAIPSVPPSPADQPAETAAEAVPTATPEPVIIYDAFYESGSYDDDCGNHWDYLLRIPAIHAPGDDARRLSQYLYDSLIPSIQDAKGAMEDGVSMIVNTVDYRVYQNGSLFSIVAEVDNDWGFEQYWTVNYDAATYTEVDRASLLARFQLTEAQFLPLAAQVVDQHFQYYYGGMTHDELWYDRHDLSVAPENFTNDCQLYVNEYGKLCMIVKYYSFAGADYYYHIFEVTGP